MPQYYVINTPLINYYFYKAPDMSIDPLVGGFLYFFDDSNRQTLLPTYSDVFDPNNPVVNPNPLPLGDAGDAPIFYLEDRYYYIVLTGPDQDLQNPIKTIEHYNPAEHGRQPASVINQNLIANGQFNYAIEFWRKNEEVGEIIDARTAVAWAVFFEQDANTTTRNIITYNDVSQEGIEGDPINELVLTSTDIQAGESLKDFVFQIGKVNFGVDRTFTFSAQLVSKLSGSVNVTLKAEKIFNIEGNTANSETIDLTTFTVGTTRQKYIHSFTLPNNAGEDIGQLNYLSLRLSCAVGQITALGVTNVALNNGEIDNPIFVSASLSHEKSLILGNVFDNDILSSGPEAQYKQWIYHDGVFSPNDWQTGERVIQQITGFHPYRVRCDGSSYNVNDYSPNNIPYRRLYEVIGNSFGGTGDLLVSANQNVTTFESAVGARELSAFDANNTGFTVTKVQEGLKMGISAVVNSATQIEVTWVGNFAPNQTTPGVGGFINNVDKPANGLMAYWYPRNVSSLISVVTVNAGSGAAQAVAELNFNDNDILDYRTDLKRWQFGLRAVGSFLEYAVETDNTRGSNYPVFNRLILFAVDGRLNNKNPNGQWVRGNEILVVPFLTRNTFEQNLTVMANAINNPFIINVTVTQVPPQSSALLYSSATVDYYAWFNVDGGGTDPSIVGRTAVEVAINSTDALAVIAEKLATATNNLVFSVPAAADLPTIPAGATSKHAWYINL